LIRDRFSLNREASQTRDYSVAKNATVRAARPDPSLRKRGSLGMTIELWCYCITNTELSSIDNRISHWRDVTRPGHSFHNAKC
jgi:hypothetical protein